MDLTNSIDAFGYERHTSYMDTILEQASELLRKHDVITINGSQYRFLVTKHAHKIIKKGTDQVGKMTSIYGIDVCIVKETNAPAIRLVRVLT